MMKDNSEGIQHVFICGSKSIGQYGGFETFVNKLSEYLQDDNTIKLHIACKANGNGSMDMSQLDGVNYIQRSNNLEFEYNDAHCFTISVPESIGPAQAIFYDIAALRYSINYCKRYHIQKPIFYILACRIGPFIGYYKRIIKKLGGTLQVNPDGHEWKRAKWSKPIKKYWKFSERLMVKHADLLICDSVNIQSYIQKEYSKYSPSTVYISYGSEVTVKKQDKRNPKYQKWLEQNVLRENEYYLIVGRFVPENNYETMLREYTRSNTSKELVIITNLNEQFLGELKSLVHFENDRRIRFVGTVYDTELLRIIREHAYAYIHGHEVGGTNPSLLEAMGATQVNLLLDVPFNREVGENTTLYWNKDAFSLADLIDEVDEMSDDIRASYGKKAKERIENHYSWEIISTEYKKIWSPIMGK